MSERLTITRPDDWHVHLRDGLATAAVLAHTARRFARAIVMPNLVPPITNTHEARAYRDRILECLPAGAQFQPLMTLYLTDNTSVHDIDTAARSDYVHAVKYYPAGATTHSESGVTSLPMTYTVLERMAETGLPLLVHGEVTDTHVDIFDREARFIDEVLTPLVSLIPGLKVVFEHITTHQAVDFVISARDGVAATITPQHMMLDRNALLAGRLRPHNYCLPVLKRQEHRQAVWNAAVSGNPKFFLGTDSAPHATHAKENSSGCAGVYSAHAALELYAEAFERAGELERLEAFASHFGADFYGLQRNSNTVTLVKKPWTVPDGYPYGNDTLTPFMAGEIVSWQLAEDEGT